MAFTYELTAEARGDKGKGASRRLRHQDKVPAIIYGGDQAPTQVSIMHKQLIKAVENEAFFSHILTITIDGVAQKAILKDLQRHPAKPRIMHADFQRVSKDQKITMHVPLHFLNENVCPGVKTYGGMASHLMTDVEVRCLPDALPEYIEVDMISMNIGDSIHLSELKIPAGVEIVELSHGAGHSHDLPVVQVQKLRAASVEDEAAPAAEEAKKDDKKE
jgi:large subunit ribosomal protein L25